jgi:quercetin 2,3-dioxygenase
MASPVLDVRPLGFVWDTADPFLFCVHHDDAYPAGNPRFGPQGSLSGRDIGQDFAGVDGWRMYHGEVVPGFPSHPHRGFETVTITRRGYIDHSDSMGAAARYGFGDVQWLTAGRGIVHAEMFPLLDPQEPNPVELFQIWLNLPARNKMVDPHFTMFWAKDVPVHREPGVELTVIAGTYGSLVPQRPPPQSWASQPDSDVAIWSVKLLSGASFTLPAARPGTRRTVYLFRGPSLTVAGVPVHGKVGVMVRADVDLPLVAGPGETEVLVLQGRPIGEPVVARGPFVMNDANGIRQAFLDYQTDGFGGWPWPATDPVHGPEKTRFARHADGRVERA